MLKGLLGGGKSKEKSLGQRLRDAAMGQHDAGLDATRAVLRDMRAKGASAAAVLESTHGEYKTTPFLTAVCTGSALVAAELVAAGCNTRAMNCYGSPAPVLAAWFQQAASLRYLCRLYAAHGDAAIDMAAQVPSTGCNVLHTAAYKNAIACVEVLTEELRPAMLRRLLDAKTNQGLTCAQLPALASGTAAAIAAAAAKADAAPPSSPAPYSAAPSAASGATALNSPAGHLIDGGDGGAQNLAPLYGIRGRKLVSLVQAVQAASDSGVFADMCYPPGDGNAGAHDYGPSLVAQAQRSVEAMEAKFGGCPPFSLSLDAAAALHLYTVESPFYHKVNALLRSPDRARLVPLFDYLALLLSACMALPKHTVHTYRGIRCPHGKLTPKGAYEKAGRVEMWSITSTARQMDKILQFLGSDGGRTILVLECRFAIDIREFSHFGSDEEEYILLPGSAFVVSSVLPQGDLTLVQMQEDPEQLFAAGWA